MEIITINYEQMTELFSNVEKNTFINLVTVTDVRMNKTNNPFYGEVKKHSSCNFYLGSTYEDRVNSNREKEGKETDFVSEPPKGKKHISRFVLTDTQTETKRYLMVERFKEVKPIFNFFYKDRPIEYSEFENFVVKSSGSPKQDLEREIIVNTYSFESIKEFTFNGRKFIVKN